MGHWDLPEKDFHDWAVKAVADIVMQEDKENFVDRFPPEELNHIYAILDEKVIPLLHAEGIPITKEEVFKMFRSWFIKRASPREVKRSDEPRGDEIAPWLPSARGKRGCASCAGATG